MLPGTGGPEGGSRLGAAEGFQFSGTAAHGHDVTAVVALATFRRPDCLARILPQLVRQVEAAAVTGHVLVVDNDPDGGAAGQVRGISSSTVRYVHEPRPGIAAARNRALAESSAADVVIFIDDDEEPSPGWLETLMRHWLDWRCAAVTGPVVATFDGGRPDPWVLASGVFDRRSRPTGESRPGAASNNLLLDVARLRDLDLRFDDRYGLTGGSDTRLTHELVARGGVIRWVDEAEVVDHIPAARATRSWVLRRTFRTSNDWSRVALDLAEGRPARVRQRLELTARALVRVLRGMRHWMLGALSRDLSGRARGLVEIVESTGMALGAFGYVASEYHRGRAQVLSAATTGSDGTAPGSDATAPR